MTYSAEVEANLRAQAAAIIARYPVGHERSALLPMLHLVQSHDSFVSVDGIAFCADILRMEQAEVSAVATFYSQFKRHPNGEYNVGVCTNALCGILGGDQIYQALSDHLGVEHDETTPDGKITLERIECNAACDYAPVIMVNWEFFDNQTPEGALEMVDRLIADQPVAPTRGPDQVPTFREVAHSLAGFGDGLANQGPSAGPESLLGKEIAAAHDWTAPRFLGDIEVSDEAAVGGATETAEIEVVAEVGGPVPAEASKGSESRKSAGANQTPVEKKTVGNERTGGRKPRGRSRRSKAGRGKSGKGGRR